MNEVEWTDEADAKLRAYLARPGYEIPKRLGDEEAACSMAAINLALDGQLTDRVPDCMSEVIGKWIIRVQDDMPDAARNSWAWRELLPMAAGTGREREAERMDVVMEWMWGTVLPHLQPVADRYRYGEAWQRMCDERVGAAAVAASYAADDAYAAAHAADAANAANAHAAYVYPAAAAYAAANAAANAAEAAEAAAEAAAAAAYAAADGKAEAWRAFDPVGLLRKLIERSPHDA